MRRLIAAAGVVCVTVLMGTGAFAQMPPPNPDNPNDTTRDSWSPLPYGPPISIVDAKKAAAAAFAETEKRHWNSSCVAIVGPSGDLMYFERQDNCQLASIEIAEHKARAAARFKRPTESFERNLGKGPYFTYQLTLDGVMASRGGIPLVVDGKIIGAIGVSGGTGSDGVVAEAGAAPFGGAMFKTSSKDGH